METPETIRTPLQVGEWVTSILPYTNSQSVQEVHAFSHPGSVLPVQSPTLWPVHSTHGVHSGGQRGQTCGFTKGYKNPPVPRQLVGESHSPPNLSPAYTVHGSSLSRTRLAGEQGKVRTGSKTGFQLRRLPVRLQGGQGQTHTRALADLNGQDIINSVQSGVPGPAVHVPRRASNSHRKASPPRSTSYETHTVALEEQLEGTRITRKGDTPPQIAPPPFKVVAGGKQCASRSTITPITTCSADIYRRIKRRVGRSLKRTHCKGNLVPSRKQVAYKPLGTKGGLSGPKRVPRPLFKQHSPGGHRQHNSGCLYQQRRGDEVELSVCPTVENPVLLHQETGNSQTTSHPGRLNVIADKLSRLRQTIQTEWSLNPEVFHSICSRWHQPQVDLFTTRFNNKLPQFVSTVPDPQAWAVDALSLSWENLDPYAFPPATILGKVLGKLQDYPCNRIISPSLTMCHSS